MRCTDFYASGEAFELYRCGDCGFLFTQGVPCSAEIGKYYETPDYISHSDSRKGLVNKIYHLVRAYMLRRKVNLVEREARQQKGRILDIGTGTGYFANAMAQRGWTVEATEKNAAARTFARTHFGLEVKEQNTSPYNTFNIITLWHVMEHIEDLNHTWQQLHEWLAADGLLIVAVPNSRSYDAQKYQAHWAAYDVPRHLWHFTPDTMVRFGSRHHFTCVRRYPMPFDAFYISILSEKYRQHKFPVLRGLCAGIAAWCSAWFRPDRSSSIIYVFKKQA